jgi:signal peptidase I
MHRCRGFAFSHNYLWLHLLPGRLFWPKISRGQFMTSIAEAGSSSPWMTIWLSPRQTIERIVAEWPHYLVLPLAVLGGVAAAAGALINLGIGSVLQDWRVWLACVPIGAIIGIANLHINAVFAAWLARRMGGQASTDAVRAVFAWGVLPTILGLLVVLAVAAGSLASGAGVASPLLIPWLRIVNVIFGLWSVVITLLMFSRVERFGFWRTMVSYWCGALLLAVSLAVFVRTILFQPFNMPAVSMAPTLLYGDYFFVSKYAYGYSHYSLPFSPPLFSGRIFASEPARGDVVTFRLPKDDATDYVKRVVGLPGDRVQMKQGLLYINDTPVIREQLPDFVGAGLCGAASAAKVKRCAKPCRMAHLMKRSTASTMASTTTPASIRCRRNISLCWETIATIRPIAAYFQRWVTYRSSISPAGSG